MPKKAKRPVRASSAGKGGAARLRASRASPVAPAKREDAAEQRAASQDRGRRRIDSILDAAERVIAESGYDAATTDAIARLSGASIGSLYHFFPNKDAILGALAARYAERMSAINAHAMPADFTWLPLDVLFERIINGQLQFSINTPAFQPVHDAAMRVFGRVGPSEKLDGALMAQVRAFLAARLPRMPAAEREAAARVSVTSVHAALDLACRLPDAERDAIAREVKRMMVLYFTPLDERFGAKKA